MLQQRVGFPWTFGFWVLVLFISLILTGTTQATPPNPIKIGVVETIYRDVPEPMIRMIMIPFSTLMKSQTGMNGQASPAGNALELGRKLENKEVHLGVFHGFEFAWAQEKYPNLRPLIIGINRDRELTANLVSRNDSPFTTFAETRGKEVSLPKRSRAHCHLFLERHCAEYGAQPEKFFGKINRHSDIETALDAVVSGRVDCLVVDGVALKCYKAIKPGCYNRLKIVKQSATFPAAVVAYREGTLDQSTLNRFKYGLINAKNNFRARHLMTMWKMTGFEAIPSNYQQILANIRQIYPAPEASQAASAIMKE